MYNMGEEIIYLKKEMLNGETTSKTLAQEAYGDSL